MYIFVIYSIYIKLMQGFIFFIYIRFVIPVLEAGIFLLISPLV